MKIGICFLLFFFVCPNFAISINNGDPFDYINSRIKKINHYDEFINILDQKDILIVIICYHNNFYGTSEKEFSEILERLMSVEYRKLHCDTIDKKYYVVGENNVTIAVNGNINKVYLLYTEDSLDIPLLMDFREDFITKIIHRIVEEKHKESEKIYEKIQQYESKLNTRILSKI